MSVFEITSTLDSVLYLVLGILIGVTLSKMERKCNGGCK